MYVTNFLRVSLSVATLGVQGVEDEDISTQCPSIA